MNTRLSVISPNYNHGHYLQERITSILDQLGQDDEYIIIDDGSTDKSVEIIQHFQDSRIKFLQNQKNVGPWEAVARGLSIAQGIYYLFLSSDDIMLPGFIKKSLKLLNENPTAAFCYANIGIFVTDPTHHTSTYMPKQHIYLLQPKETVHIFRTTPFRMDGFNVIRKEAFVKYGGFDQSLIPYSDSHFCYAVAFNEPIIYLPEVLNLLRLNGTNYHIYASNNIAKRTIFLKLWRKENAYLRKQYILSLELLPYMKGNFIWAITKPSLYYAFIYTLFHGALKKVRCKFMTFFKSPKLKQLKVVQKA